MSDFIIEDGVLRGYRGDDGDVTVPDGVTVIGGAAFANRRIRSVTLPEGVTGIESNAFYGCHALTAAHLPASLTRIERFAFDACEQLCDITLPAGLTALGEGAFDMCAALPAMDIPAGVTRLENNLFRGCTSLARVTLPDALTGIGADSFSGCKALPALTLQAGVEEIGDGAFCGCDAMADENGMVVYHGKLFHYAGPGGDVTLPDGLTEICHSAFFACESLTGVVIPEGVTALGERAFQHCSALRSIRLPAGLKRLGNLSLAYCKSLPAIDLPDGLEIVDERVFESDEALREVLFPDSVKELGGYMFLHCHALERVRLPAGMTDVGPSMFSHCERLGEAALPEGVTSIGKYGFYACAALTAMALPSTVKSIDNMAFGDCVNLREITFPAGLESISEWAFYGCKSLKKFEMAGDKAKITKDVFRDVFPTGLVKQLGTIYPHMADGALKQYVLVKKVWDKLDPALQREIFVNRQGKPLTAAYGKCISAAQVEPLGEGILAALSGKASAKTCTAAANYMVMFREKASPALLQKLYEALKAQKAGAKAVKAVEEDVNLMELLGQEVAVDDNLPAPEKRVMALLLADKRGEKELAETLKAYYGLTFADLPALPDADGRACEAYVLAWLLTAHETLKRYNYELQPDVVASVEQPGPRPEAAEILALLDPAGVQAALLSLADGNLGLSGRSKKMFLAYPICRYADEAAMAELTARAPKWRSSVSGNDAPPLLTFRRANLYSDTRAAMLFAERYKELGQYAQLRGMDEDTLRDTVLSELGLDETGKKTFDLGGTTLEARLAADLTLELYDTGAGKVVKSVPKKNADPAKYEAAKEEIAALRKNIKKIAKTRSDRLFDAFLSGHTFEAANWKSVHEKNPLLRQIARLLVWKQDRKTFLLAQDGAIDSSGKPCALSDKPIRVAHPMEMKPAEVEAWQKYFASRGLRQPFAQVWEPVVDLDAISPERYQGVEIEIGSLRGKERHGIHEYNVHAYSEDFGFALDDCTLEYEASDWRYVDGGVYRLGTFAVKKRSRMANHVVTVLDRLTVEGRLLRDDVSIAASLDGFTLAQITELLALASKNNCPNVTALLLDYKNEHFADFDPMAEFTLD